MKQKVPTVFSVSDREAPPGPGGLAELPLPAVLRLPERVDHHEHAEDRPEEDVLPDEEDGASQPEPLVGVQEPRHQEHEQGRKHQRHGVPVPAQLEVRRVVEHLEHEVLPVDVDPAPEVRDARREEVLVVRLRQPEAEQVQHAHDQVELARDPQVQQEVRDHVLREIARAVNLRRREREVVVDDTVEDEVNDPAHHPVHADLVDPVCVVVEVVPPEGLVVDDREEREAGVRQHEEVRERVARRTPARSSCAGRRDRRSAGT